MIRELTGNRAVVLNKKDNQYFATFIRPAHFDEPNDVLVTPMMLTDEAMAALFEMYQLFLKENDI